MENPVSKESTPPSHSVKEPTPLYETLSSYFKKHRYQMITDKLWPVNKSGPNKKDFFFLKRKAPGYDVINLATPYIAHL